MISKPVLRLVQQTVMTTYYYQLKSMCKTFSLKIINRYMFLNY